MQYYLTLLSRAIRLHLLRWNRYRTDVFIWLITIWITIGIHVCFVFVVYDTAGGLFFGYSPKELVSFFGITLFATGLAQSIIHGGLVVNLAKTVWSGNFDYWLTQPAPLLWRMLLEDMGFIWFWPHITVGTILLFLSLPASHWPLGFAVGLVAAAIEIGLMLCLCLPSIRWGRWDPNEGLWEYMENSRLMPIGRTNNNMLWIASFGVLHYSLSLEVLTGKLSLLILIAIACLLFALAWVLLRILVRSYGSASS
ncbi:MAG: ABC-2 family transporter protein [Candidatus Peregrinibacteria bacterium]